MRRSGSEVSSGGTERRSRNYPAGPKQWGHCIRKRGILILEVRAKEALRGTMREGSGSDEDAVGVVAAFAETNQFGVLLLQGQTGLVSIAQAMMIDSLAMVGMN